MVLMVGVVAARARGTVVWVFEGLPSGLVPPVSLALAKAVGAIPPAGALPGGCLYEVKWDGFRAVFLVGAAGVSLWSRQGKDLSRFFPDLVAAAAGQIPPGCVVDGEAVIWFGAGWTLMRCSSVWSRPGRHCLRWCGSFRPRSRRLMYWLLRA